MVAREFPKRLGFERLKKVLATSYASEMLLRDLPAAWDGASPAEFLLYRHLAWWTQPV